jgi:5-methylcytosine-specific restriction endonuclease McrA
MGLSGDHRMGPTIDHLIPVSKGGADVPENVALAHRSCNCARGNRGAVQLRLAA